MYREDKPRPPDIAGALGPTTNPPGSLVAPTLGASGRWWLVALATYLVAMGALTALHALWPAAGLLLILLCTALARALVSHKRTESVFIALNLAMVAGVLALAGPEKAIGLTLAIAQAVVGALFLRSLYASGADIITRIACAVRAERSVRELRYTRNVCRAWAAFMLGLAALSLTFTFVAPERLWWAWKLFGSWGLPVAFFCAEWALRHWVLRREKRNGFRNSLQALRHIDYPRLFEL
jgi:uncharacterized membrane protein